MTKDSLHFIFIRNDDGSIGDEFWLYNYNATDSKDTVLEDNNENNNLSGFSLIQIILGISVVSIVRKKENSV